MTSYDITGPDDRTPAPVAGDEKETLTGFLRYHRQTFLWKCSGVELADMANRRVGASDLTLLGLVRHLADVERGWFRRRLARQDAEPVFWSRINPDGEFDVTGATAQTVEEAWIAWRREVDFAERFVAEAPNLDITCDDPPWRYGLSLRWVLTHMIEEYARHNGHVDLIRESIDGLTGQ